MSHPLEIIQIQDTVPYTTAHEWQCARQRAVHSGQAPNTLYLLQHPPVITLGREAKPEHILLNQNELTAQGIEVVQSNRGGGVTYHGPGQLIAYPILDLNQWQRSVGWYLRTLEEVIIQTLANYGLDAGRLPGYTGVWVDGAKVAAIGAALRHWTTMHGAALNVAPNMDHFRAIIPCGIADKPVTSIEKLLGTAPPLEDAAGHFIQAFCCCFDATPGPGIGLSQD